MVGPARTIVKALLPLQGAGGAFDAEWDGKPGWSAAGVLVVDQGSADGVTGARRAGERGGVVLALPADAELIVAALLLALAAVLRLGVQVDA